MAQLRIPLDAQRFAKGLTWKDYVAQMGDTRGRTEDNYAKATLTDEERKFFSSVTGVRYVLMLAENWCGDVHRNSPLIARICETMPGCELRVFFRDQNKDIMAEFLKDGEFESVPTIVLYDRNMRYLGHWIERADRANAEMPVLRKLMEGVERDTPAYEAARAKYQAATWDHAEGWRDAQLSEIRALLDEALT